jgi:putative endonuclease
VQKKQTTKQIGDEWEFKARIHLESLGYTCVIQNYRSGRNEIDLIMKFDKKLIFVEVKFRKNKEYGNPEDFVTKAKLKRLKTAAEAYTFKTKWPNNIRFDILAITPEEIMHFIDVD